jgi:hypothetical protein
MCVDTGTVPNNSSVVPPGAHESLQVDVSFPAMIEPEAENLPPLGVGSKIAIFSQIQPNISFPQQA